FGNVVDKVSNKAYAQVVDAAKINWKDPVESFGNLPSGASEGDTRMARDTGKVYRYDGNKWNEIQQIDAGPVNEVDTRLSSQLAETATKEDLQDVESNKMDKNTSDISVNQINKNKGLIDETYLSDELKQQMAGDTPIHSTPADDSITRYKLTNDSVGIENIEFAEKTENLFEGYQRGIIDPGFSPWRLGSSETGVC